EWSSSFFFFSSRRRHTRSKRDWSSDVCSSDLLLDEPPRRSNGYRDYTMADVVRLMRIRWLAGSGVPLDAIAGMLDQDTAQPVERSEERRVGKEGRYPTAAQRKRTHAGRETRRR